MKKVTLLFALFLISYASTTAQSRLGIKGGVNFSNLAVDKDQIDEANTKPGFTLGLINTNQMGLLFVQSELLYNRKGAEYKLGDIGVDADLNYLQVPLSVGGSLFGLPLNIYGGGYAAFLLSANYDFKNGDEVIATYDNKDAFNKWDLGVHAGLNLQLDKVIFDFRLSRGLSNVENEDIITNIQTFTKNDTKNFNAELTLAYQF